MTREAVAFAWSYHHLAWPSPAGALAQCDKDACPVGSKSHLGQIILWTSKVDRISSNIAVATGRGKQGHRHGIKEGTLTSPRVPTNQKGERGQTG